MSDGESDFQIIRKAMYAASQMNNKLNTYVVRGEGRGRVKVTAHKNIGEVGGCFFCFDRFPFSAD